MHFVLENYINGKGYLNLSEEGGWLVPWLMKLL